MNHQAEILLLKNKLRLLKGTVRHTWQGLIGMIAVSGVFLYQFLSVVFKAEYVTEATSKGVFYALLIVAVISLFRVFINQTPVFRMEAASVLHTYNTKYFRKSLMRKQLYSVFTTVLASGLLAYVLSGFLFNLVFLKLWLLLALYMNNCTFLSWIFYHAKGKLRWIICIVFSLCTLLLFLRSLTAAVFLAIFLCVVWIYAQRFLRLDLPKYKKRIHRLEAASFAASQNDFAGMRQMAEESRPAYVRNPMLYHFKPNKKTALWLKSLLEFFRMQKQTVTILFLLLLLGWLISRTTLLRFIPLLDEPAITRMIAVFCTATALSALHQLLVQQAKTVSDKRRMGLPLPYSTKQIVVSYGLTATMINLLITLAIGLLYEAFSLRLLLLLFSAVISYFASCCSQLYHTKFQRGALTLSNLLLFAGVYGLLML